MASWGSHPIDLLKLCWRLLLARSFVYLVCHDNPVITTSQLSRPWLTDTRSCAVDSLACLQLFRTESGQFNVDGERRQPRASNPKRCATRILPQRVRLNHVYSLAQHLWIECSTAWNLAVRAGSCASDPKAQTLSAAQPEHFRSARGYTSYTTLLSTLIFGVPRRGSMPFERGRKRPESIRCFIEPYGMNLRCSSSRGSMIHNNDATCGDLFQRLSLDIVGQMCFFFFFSFFFLNFALLKLELVGQSAQQQQSTHKLLLLSS